MDPNVTLDLIISTFRARDEWEECREACHNLEDWLAKGGFAPGPIDARDLKGFCRIVSRVCLSQMQRQEA